MVFVIEVSFYLHQHSNTSFFKRTLVDIAETNGCITHYFMEEIRGNNFVSIHVVHFPSEINNTWQACDYIKEVKKIKQLLIESVYYDQVKGQILYASREYLKTMDDTARCEINYGKSSKKSNYGKSNSVSKQNKYDSKKRERSYSESELMLLNALNKYKKSNKSSKRIMSYDTNDIDTVKRDMNDLSDLKSKDLKNNNSNMVMSYSKFLEITNPNKSV